MRSLKRLLSLFMSFALAMTMFTGMSVSGAAQGNTGSYTEENLPVGGIRQSTNLHIDEEEAARIAQELEESEEGFEVTDITLGSSYKFSSDYLYSTLNTDEKKFYDGMRSACESVLSSTKDYTTSIRFSGFSYDYYVIADVPYTGLEFERAYSIYTLFVKLNPQYYFISYRYSTSSQNGITLLFSRDYGHDFSKYSERKAVQTVLDSLVEEWMPEVEALSGEVEKEMLISDKICDYLTYDNPALSNDDLAYFDQSIASCALRQTTLCAGYAALTTYFCNAAGLDCLSVTSDTHGWNLIKLYNNWYQLDNTFVDTGKSKKWINRSYAAYQNMEQASDHVYNSMWSDFALPETLYDEVQLPEPSDFVITNGVLTAYTGSDENIEIPSGVTEIADEAFKSNKTIKSVKFPSSLKKIGQKAFYYCTYLTSVTFNDGLEFIGNSAFYNCPLKTLVLPDSLKQVDEFAFAYAEMTTVNVPLNIELVQLGLFSTKGVFYGCQNITTVVFPEGITYFENFLTAIPGIKKLVIPATVTKLASAAFHNCPDLEEVEFKGALPKIDVNTFNNCPKLKKVTCVGQDSVRSAAFRLCSSLTDVYLGDHLNTIVEEAFDSCTSLKVISLPSPLAEIPADAFKGCTSLTDVYIPDSVTTISDTAFPEGVVFTVHGGEGTAAETFAIANGLTFVADNNTARVNVTAKYSDGNGIKVTWDAVTGATKYAVARIDKDGHYETLASGITGLKYEGVDPLFAKTNKYIVRAYINGAYKNFLPEDAVTPLSANPKNVSTLSYTYTKSLSYTGSALTPSVTVKDGSTTLAKDTDYTLEYSDNTNAGTAKITVTGIGNYTGTIDLEFTITARNVSGLTVSEIPKQTYTGEEITPEITVMYKNVTLVENTDYTLTYSNNIKAGSSAKVVITGKGNFTGTRTEYFTISAAAVGTRFTISPIADQTYKGSAVTPDITVKDGEKTLVKGTDYTVEYSDNINVGTASVNVKGKGNYTGNKMASFKIVPKNIGSLSLWTDTSMAYTGSELTPDVTLKDGTKTLVRDTDYTLGYSDNINVGVATITITGKGNYTGTSTTTFRITGRSAIYLTLSDVEDQEYTGSAIKPEITVKDDAKTLVSGTDYSVSYSDNTNVGTAFFTVSLTGNYSGKLTGEFTITARNASNFTISGIADRTYTGSAITPGITVKDGTKTLKLNTDYTVEYSDNINVGEATVTVTGKGNYTGTKTATFNIIADENAVFVISDIADQTYTGSEITPEITVKDGSKTLAEGTDYTVVFSGNIEAGTAAVTVTGKGNYSGIKTAEFKILPKNASDFTITGISDKEYTGEEFAPALTITDGKKILVQDTDYTVVYSDNINAGTASVTVTYSGNYTGTKTVTFKIAARSADNFTVSPISDQIYTGLAIKPEVTVYDGSKLLEADKDYTVSYSDNTEVGTATVTVTGKGNYTGTKTAEFRITEKELVITGITVIPPTKLTYIVGEALDLNGGKITVTYEEGEPAEFDITPDMLVNGFNSAAVGPQTITVKYGEFTDEFEVTVLEEKPVKGISVIEPASVPKLYVGGTLDLTGYMLNIVYDDDTDESIALTVDMVTGFDPDKAGSQTLTVTYGDKTATFTVVVEAVTVTGISVAKSPKTLYNVGDTIDLSAGVLSVTYSNGKTANVPMTGSGVTYSGFSSTKAGPVDVTVSFGGKSVVITMQVVDNTPKSPVMVGDKDYNTLSEALNSNSGTAAILVTKTIDEKSIDIPAKYTSVTITTANGAAIRLVKPSITTKCNLTLDCTIICPDAKAKALTVKAGDNKVVINSLAASLPVALTGTKNTQYVISTGSVMRVAATGAVCISVSSGTTLKIDGVKFAPTKLTGAGKLDVYNAAAVAPAEIGTADITLHTYRGKNNILTLPKLTLGTFTSVKLTVKDPDGSYSDIKDKAVAQLAKTNIVENLESKITITNMSGTNRLDAAQYKKDIYAQYFGGLTVSDGTTAKDYPTLAKALESMTNTYANYTVTLNEDTEISKLSLPKQVKSLTIDGDGNTLKLIGITSISAKYGLTLKDITIAGLNKKNEPAALTLSVSSGDAVIKGLNYTGSSLSIKGGKTSKLTVYECTPVTSLTGFGSLVVYDELEIVKTLSVNNLMLGSASDLKLMKGASLTQSDKYGYIVATSGAKITITEGIKPLTVKGRITGRIKIASTGTVGKDGIKLFKVTKGFNLLNHFETIDKRYMIVTDRGYIIYKRVFV